MSFESLNVKPEIVRALNYKGIEKPTSIQNKAIPLIRSGKDVIGISKTGSGKTASFGIPLLEAVIPGAGLQALVLTPTRELAAQIAQQFEELAVFMDVSIAAIYGGVSISPQVEQIARADIVVATPKRLIDHIRKRNIDLSSISCFVLDEADIMADMGFIESITKILDYTPNDRQILLFGATISDEIDEIRDRYMYEPEVARVGAYVGDELLKQYYYDVRHDDKFSLLLHLMEKEQPERAIVFCSTRLEVESIAKNLRANGIKAGLLHGKLRQNSRLKVVDNFNDGKPAVLVTSGVASRGLDIKYVSHVFNYGLSSDPQEYIHRIGRTARAGQSGKAITLLGPGDKNVFERIIRRYAVYVKKLPREEFKKVELRSERALVKLKAAGKKKSSNASESDEKDSGPDSANGPKYVAVTKRSDVSPGMDVHVILKKDQRSGKLTPGKVKDILTKSPNHPRGIKVRLEDGAVGRVQKIME